MLFAENGIPTWNCGTVTALALREPLPTWALMMHFLDDLDEILPG